MSFWSGRLLFQPPLLLLAFIEALVIVSSIFAAGLIVSGSLSESARLLDPFLPKAAATVTVALACFFAVGLYHLQQRLYFQGTVLRVMVGLTACSIVLSALSYLRPSVAIESDVAGIALCFSLILLIGVRYIFVKTIDENIFRRKVFIIGTGEQASAIHDLRRRADRRGFKIVGQIPERVESTGDSAGPPNAAGMAIALLAAERSADEIVIAVDDRRGNLPVRDLLQARLRGIDVIDLVDFLERETGKIRVGLIKPGWLVFSNGFRSTRYRQFVKRAFDLLLSLSIILVAWPVVLLVALAIKLEDGLSAPIFYRQVRAGLGQKPFKILKFRSMRTDAEADGKPVWAQKGDLRITNVGRFLRLSRLDELPQLFNVLCGDMSIVGPRPERPEFVRELAESIPYYAERHFAKPGLTGWAQLRYAYGASLEDTIEKLEYDLYYVKNQSLIFDLLIVLQTAEVVLWGKGAR